MTRLILIIAFGLLGVIACDPGDSSDTPANGNGISGDPVTPVERPAAVPPEAEAVREEQALGSIERSADAPPEAIDTRVLLTAACEGDMMTLFTDQETIYAALACDRFWDDDTVQAFSSQESAIRLTVDSTRFQIFIETLDGGQAEFTVGGIWVE